MAKKLLGDATIAVASEAATCLVRCACLRLWAFLCVCRGGFVIVFAVCVFILVFPLLLSGAIGSQPAKGLFLAREASVGTSPGEMQGQECGAGALLFSALFLCSTISICVIPPFHVGCLF